MSGEGVIYSTMLCQAEDKTRTNLAQPIAPSRSWAVGANVHYTKQKPASAAVMARVASSRIPIFVS